MCNCGNNWSGTPYEMAEIDGGQNPLVPWIGKTPQAGIFGNYSSGLATAGTVAGAVVAVVGLAKKKPALTVGGLLIGGAFAFWALQNATG